MEKIKFSEWLELWMKKEKPFLKESTYATYTNIIENHIKTSLGQKKLDEIIEYAVELDHELSVNKRKALR